MTAFVLSTMLAVAAPVPKEADARFAKEVAKAREKAIEFLKKRQKEDGTWEDTLAGLAGMDGGQTGLVTLALLQAGVPADDKAVAKAVGYLAKLEPKRTYVVSLQTQVLARVDAKKHAKQIQKNADWLLMEAVRKNGTLEGWSYPGNTATDGSNTHFAVMGLHAAAQAGAKIDEGVWKEIRDMYDRTQAGDGGWRYTNASFGDKTTPSMTASALLGLTVAAKYDPKAKGPGAAFDKGLKSLAPWAFDSSKSTGCDLFTAAELGRAAGKTEFKVGDRTWAWYREGAEKLMKAQQPDGSFALGKSIDAQPVLATAFGLYFLGGSRK